jgi:galactose mutarotase-like enzyme
MRPDRGGRITSLKLGGEELLDQGIGVDDPSAGGFVESGAFGWDEMVPNVEATESLPDHGEAWRLPWEVLRAAGIEVAMRCRGRVVPWELVRSVRLGDALIAVYSYRNAGSEPHPAYWCAHPLFRFEPGMEIGVPGGERLANLAEGTSRKVHLPKGSIDHATLRWPSGLGIEISWDPDLTPYVGVWVCNGDLGGYRQVAVEPATGGLDRPDRAAPPPLLAPGKTLGWWLQIRPL